MDLKWTRIPNYNDYEINILGEIESIKSNIMLAQTKNNVGYFTVGLCNNTGKKRTFQVHQLMAITFLNHKPNGHKIVVDHINNNKTDNRLENLQLITHRENISKEGRGSSKYTGVSIIRTTNKWRSSITINGVYKILGYFKTEKVASAVYQYELEKHLTNETNKRITKQESTTSI